MVKEIYQKCLEVLRKKPVELWGLSLLGALLMCLAQTVGVLPVISIPVTLVLAAGMAVVYLKGYKGEKVAAEQIFDGFKNFGHVLGGMAWMSLWVFIWSLIPVVGPVFGIMKAYSYAFTPYILMNEPEIPATEAIKVSMKRTEGYKGSMFLCDFILGAAIVAVCLALTLLGLIPYVGYVFWFLLPLVALAVSSVAPLCTGLIKAAFVERAASGPAPTAAQAPQGFTSSAYTQNAAQTAAQGGAKYCASCGAALEEGQKFCARCGAQQ